MTGSLWCPDGALLFNLSLKSKEVAGRNCERTTKAEPPLEPRMTTISSVIRMTAGDERSALPISRGCNSGLELVQFGTQFAQRLSLGRARVGCQILRLKRIVFQIIKFFSSIAGETNQFVLYPESLWILPFRFRVRAHTVLNNLFVTGIPKGATATTHWSAARA